MAGKRSTDAETEKRVSVIYDLLLQGARRKEILQYVAEKTDWGVCERQVDGYIQKANREFAKRAKTRRDQELGKALARRELLLQKTLKVQDYKAALAVEKDRCKLLDLYPKKETPEDDEEKFVLEAPPTAKSEEEWEKESRS